MLGRKDYTRKEFDRARSAVGLQLAAHKKLVAARGNGASGKNATAALADFDGLFFNNGNPLSEVELICDSLISNGGVLRGINAIKYIPDQSVPKLIVDRIRLSAYEFERLSAAFFTEVGAPVSLGKVVNAAERAARLAATLERAEQVHGIVTERTGGADPEWALFYGWWLINWSDLPEILGSTPGMGDLTARLIALDTDYRSASRDEPWSAFYARKLLAESA